MVCLLEKNIVEDDRNAEERTRTPLEESLVAPTHVITDPLINGLFEDIVLGEVLTRVPWYDLPMLKTLNRSWAHALTHSFPLDAGLHQLILPNSLVIYRIPSSRYPNSYLGLWVYNYGRVFWRLPIPPIPENLHRFVQFVLDDNYDCIFSFTRIREEDGRLRYNVSMLDLSHGTMCSWKSLPSLLVRFSKYPIECIRYPYSCSSFKTTQNGTCIKLLFRSWGHGIDQHSFSVWTLDGRTDSEWQCQPITGPLIDRFSGAVKNTPFYVEIKVNIPLRGRTKSVKYLYKRCEQWRYNPEGRFSRNGTPEYIFMFKNDKRHSEHSIMDFKIYHIKVRETYTSSQVSFHKAKLDDESKIILHASQWNNFQDFWRPLAPPSHNWEAPRFSDWENAGRSVMKIASHCCSVKNGINAGIVWDKKKFKIGGGAHKTYEEKESINIRVAQKGHAFHIYNFVGKSEMA